MKTYPDALKTVQNAGISTGKPEPVKAAAETDNILSSAQAFLTALGNTPFDLYRIVEGLFLARFCPNILARQLRYLFGCVLLNKTDYTVF